MSLRFFASPIASYGVLARSTMENERHSGSGSGTLLARMLFFSDAFFAIVLTLLVLELRLPTGVTDASLFRGVLEMEPKLVAFAITFALVGVFWVAHVSIMRRLNAFDWLVAWVNLLFLFTVALTPFVSSLLGEYSVFGNAWRLYCMALIAIGSAQFVLFLVIYRGNGRLIGGVGRREFWHRLIRAVSPAASFALLLALSLMGFTRSSVFLSFLIVPITLVLVRVSLSRKR
jgi:uncharacterized membrane protein